MSVKGTTRNDFNPDLVITLIENNKRCDEWGRILGEACCVIYGLRKELTKVKQSLKDINTDPSHFE